MKNIFAAVLLMLSFLCGACKKTKTQSPDIQMSAHVNNRAWVSYSANTAIQQANTIHVVITADSANTHMKLNIGSYTGKGTYNISISDTGNTASYIGYSKTSGSVTHKATSGKIIITNSTSNGTSSNGITGTFEFNADSIAVTAGQFNVKLDFN